MGRVKGEETKVVRVPLSRVAEVMALLGRPPKRKRKQEPEVQRDEPTALVGIAPVQALTPGVEAGKCIDCGRMIAHPLRYGPEHYRTCGRWKNV
jgi:hypothetical protein